jgi:hypothetical protein
MAKKVKVTEEEFQRSAILAERVAEYEISNEFLRQAIKDGHQVDYILKNGERLYRRKLHMLQRDMLAQELLPQARIRMRQERARELAMESLDLMRLVNSLEVLETDGVPEQNAPGSCPFIHDPLSTLWEDLLNALRGQKNREAIIRAISGLVGVAAGELVRAELPPPPQPYVYNEMSYAPKDVY